MVKALKQPGLPRAFLGMLLGGAFGFGLERMAMLRHGLPDIRELWENDLRLLRQF